MKQNVTSYEAEGKRIGQPRGFVRDSKAQLEEYARRRGVDPAVALDDALAAYLEWERQDFAEAVEGIRQGHEDVKAGLSRPAAEFLADMRRKHDIPR